MIRTGSLKLLGLSADASTVAGMDTLGYGLITLVNGVVTTVTTLVHPLLLGGILLAASLLWLARLEHDEMDRMGVKPMVDRH